MPSMAVWVTAARFALRKLSQSCQTEAVTPLGGATVFFIGLWLLVIGSWLLVG
jgi:uncharacterized membrane protein YgdD (TMEM256/DUF423 family)